MFEWQRNTSGLTDTPHYDEILKFVNLRAQASEHSVIESSNKPYNELKKTPQYKPFPAHTANVSQSTSEPCVLCKTVSHPLFSCSKFKALPHDRKMATVKGHDLCLNCLRPGHFVNHCKSLHKCHECQRLHHTLLHLNTKTEDKSQQNTSATSNHATAVRPSSLLMTCQISVTSPAGLTIEARALLDAGSSISFISDRLSRTLQLRHCPQSVTISGIAGITHSRSNHAVTSFHVSPLQQSNKQFSVSAIVVPQVTCKLPTCPTSADTSWNHLKGLVLADPNFGKPSNVDVLLGVDVFVATLLDGRRPGPQGAPSALETEFGWVLAGGSSSSRTPQSVSHHATLLTGDDLLRRFWEIEEATPQIPILSSEERMVMEHFTDTHSRSKDGRFITPLPKRTNVPDISESRSQAVRRFLNLERSLHSNNRFGDFAEVIEEYFSLGHAEEVPIIDLQKPPRDVFYMPMHAVYKRSSTTTKTRVVFHASAKSSFLACR